MKNKCDYLLILIIVAVNTQIALGTATVNKQHCREEEKPFQNPPDGICSSMQITNNLDQLGKLENCTVVEGSVQISLMEKSSSEDYDKWSFPLLREITTYLTLYRVYGLKSLRHLFPNLSIIGGRQLFNNYALVVYEMTDLEELGLVSLRTISRGGVRITKSKKLCYVDTVDWERLGVDPGAQDFKDNKEESQCANYCPEECPTTTVGNVESKRCWTSQHCQQGINCHCRMNQTCMDNGTCCHEYCLGGCTGPGPEDCFSCKGVSYQGRCHLECPPSVYMYADRRCLTARECFAVVNTTDTAKNTKILKSNKSELRVCVPQCPQNYTVREDGELKNLECIKCEGFCPKVCNGSEISSIEDAQKLKDCSKIVGNLAIQIMGGSNVAYEMEKNLGNIKEVTGYILITRSYALMTLYFLKSLEIIRGDTLFNNRHSFIVMDNYQLQELFPEEQMKKMKLKNGLMSFHTNRKLCNSKIKTFAKYLNLTNSELDIGDNGNLIPCVERELSLNVSNTYHNAVLLKWEKDDADERHLLAYIINYKEIKSKDDDINIYDGRDACSADSWMTNEVLPSNDSESFQTFALKDLKAFTEYAVYIQTYTLSSATHLAMTNITTFKTNSYYPSEPVDIEVTSDDPHELYVKWKPPKFPNGIVTHYKVLYQKQELDIKSFEQRDYCQEPISAPSETTKSKKEEIEKTHNITADCCPCPKTKEEREAEARKREIEIYFENYLHDQVYCERYDNLPLNIGLVFNKLDIDVTLRSFFSRNNTNTFGEDPFYRSTPSADNDTNEAALQNNSWTGGVIQEVIVNDTEIFLPNLEHFQEYSIEIQACHDTNSSRPVDSKLCSNRALTAGRTKASWIMDKINESTIDVQIIRNTTVDVIITWESPPKPNGLFLTYNIFYKRANQENLVPQQICVNIREFQKNSGYRLTGLDPGNWTFQINAVSLAGNSSLTSEKYFIVPHLPGDEEANRALIIVLVLVVLILIIAGTSLFVYIKYRQRKDEMTVIAPNPNYLSSEPMYTMDDWEVDRGKIRLIKELGQGSFGMVYEGLAKGIGEDPDEEISVAVKTVNDRASFNDRREFLKEATTMKAFNCYHVVKLLGVVSTGQPVFVVMELMALGDLKNYLREHRPNQLERPEVTPPKLLDILQMAGEIADGMAYLADKKFVHRDLAARNCMVAEDKTVKIGDFGMTRDVYETDYYRKGGKGMLPIRWMAPESLRDGVFTSMSDVWSYGVVMWEMLTLAEQPYQGLSNEQAVKFISEKNTMDMPKGCSEDVAHLIRLCWEQKSKDRPTFKQIIDYLRPNLNPRFEKVSYYFNDGGGPMDRDGSMAGDISQAGRSVDSESINSQQSCEAAATSGQSFSNIRGNYQFGGSPHTSGDHASLYDDDMDPERYIDADEEHVRFYPQSRGLHVSENFEDFSDFKIDTEIGVDLNDSSLPFISGDFQEVPHVKTWHPPLLSHQSGNDSTQHNSGLLERQPLINKDSGLVPFSLRPTNVQSSSPYSSERTSRHPPRVATYDLRMPSGSQTLHPQHITAAESLKSGSASGGSHLGQPNRPLSAKPLSLVAQPTLRLPTLNQPPSGGLRRVPAYKQGDKVSSSDRSSQRNDQPSSGDWDHQHHNQPTTSNVSVVNSEEETSPTSPAQQCVFPLGAIASSSDDSKESSKSSGSHSHINGLTNGHIPILKHRPAPC